VIASGAEPAALARAADGRAVGTRFVPDERRRSAFKLWLRYGKPERGRVSVDAGAQRALERDGASLLPVGVTGVAGRFSAGDAVTVCGPDGTPFARGLASIDSATLARAAGRRSDAAGVAEAIHRDYLVLHGDRVLD
jgi:glutamate 5-kinase